MIITCPECKKPVSSMAGTCPHCGIGIAGHIAQCPHCNAYNLMGKTECAFCHNTIETDTQPEPEKPHTEPTPAPKQKKKKGRKRSGCFWFFLFLALVVSLAAAFYYWQEETKKQKEEADYRLLENVTNPSFYQQFLDDYPQSQHKDLVVMRMQKLVAENAEWQEVLKARTRIQLLKFMQNHPHTHHKRECEDLIDSIDWADAMQIGTHEAVANYLELHPNGQNAETAAGKLNELAKTRISKEERIHIRGTIESFFSHGLAKQDTLLISMHIPQTMTDFCGTRQATPQQIAQFNQSKATADVLGIHYLINNDMNIKRETLEDGTMGFAVDLIVEETINRSDATQPSHTTLKVNAWLNNEKKIVRMDIK